MNQIAIAIKLNDQQILIGAQWSTIRTFKAMTRLKLARLKRRWRDSIVAVAEIIIPLPHGAAV